MTDPPGGPPEDVGGTTPTPHGMPSPKRHVGRYQIMRQIGRGGMATVYLARQTQLERNVALKELSTFHASAPEFAERFLRESRLAGSLNHPNIVTVFEYFEEGGTPYIAMEYVERGSLRPYVGRLALAQFAGAMEGILAGLAHAESYGIVHRDLKPENIMVTAEGRVKITDFGIAKATQSAGTAAFLTATGTTVGTPTYMAPEQAMAQPVGMWTDLYSVGVMAYEHVVGHVPFYDTDAPMVILMRHVNEPIPPAIEVNSHIDAELSGWIDRLLVKDPGKRTQTAVGAWEELEEIVLQLLGPRWRREARLPEHITALDTPRPLTPAPFESMPMPMPTPKPMVPGALTPGETAGAPPPQPAAPSAPEQPAYLTFGRAAESVAPEAAAAAAAGATAAEAAAPPPAAETPPAAAETPPAAAEAPPAVEDSATTTPEEAPPAPQDDRVTPESPDYMTFGAAPEVREPPDHPPDEGTPREGGPAIPPEASAAAAAAGAAYMTYGRAPEPATAPEPPPEPPHESAASPAVAPQPPAEPERTADPQPPAPGPDETVAAIGGAAAAAELSEPAEAPAVDVPDSSAATPPPVEAPEEEERQPEPEPEPEPEREPAPAAVAAAPARSRPSTRPEVARRRVAAVGLIAAVAAAAVGFLIAHGSSKSQPPAPAMVGSASSGPVQVSLLPGWASHKVPTSANVGLSNELAVAPSAPTGGLLVIGTAAKTDATLLPAGFVATLQGTPTPQTVTLGHTQFYRFLNLTPKGAQNPETAYAVPSTIGSVVAICRPQGASTTFLSNCERIIGTLQLSSASVLGLGPSSSYAAGLKTAIGELNAHQSSAGARLASAKKAGDQARAAGDLATAFRQAGSAVAKLQPGPAAASTNAAIATALQNIGAGYAAMGQAAAHNNDSGYNGARRKIASATAGLRTDLNRLSQLGYTAA